MAENDDVQIVVPGVPKELVDEIDAMAAAEERPRAGIVRRLLAEIVEQKRLARGAKAKATA